jgi:hypothetical protein
MLCGIILVNTLVLGNGWKFEFIKVGILEMSNKTFNNFMQALENRDLAGCRANYRPSFADEFEELGEVQFIWPILIERPPKEFVKTIKSLLEINNKDISEFILANIPETITNRQLVGLFERFELPNGVARSLVTKRPSLFEHIKDWKLEGISERTAQQIIDAGFGTKVSPDGHVLSFAFIKANADAMNLQRYVDTASRRGGHNGPASLLAISICERMPPVNEMIKFTKEYHHKCCRDVPQDYVDEMPHAVQRIRDYYERIGANIGIPEMQVIARHY